MVAINSKTGKKYDLQKTKTGWTAKRLDTGSTVNISEKLVQRTRERLEAGEEIPFRSISYTVAIETAVVHLLRDIIKVDEVNRIYAKA